MEMIKSIRKIYQGLRYVTMLQNENNNFPIKGNSVDSRFNGLIEGRGVSKTHISVMYEVYLKTHKNAYISIKTFLYETQFVQ